MSKPPFQLKIGQFTCYVVQDSTSSGGGDILIPNIDEQTRQAGLVAWGDDPDTVTLSYNCLFIEAYNHKILVDAGGGEGDLLSNLAAIGVQPADIDIIILSHGHGDHYGGLSDGAGKLTFANAQHFIWRKEWEWWTNETQIQAFEETAPGRADAIRNYLLPLAPNLQFLDDNNPQVVPGVTAIAAYGHTLGHIALHIESGDEHLLFIGDAMLHPLHIQHLDWQFGMDADHDQARQTRIALLEQAYATQATVVSYHFKFPGAGHVTKIDEGWDWTPLET